MQLDARGLRSPCRIQTGPNDKAEAVHRRYEAPGSGTFVVDRLSRTCGTSPTVDGKKVRALLPTPPRATGRQSDDGGDNDAKPCKNTVDRGATTRTECTLELDRRAAAAPPGHDDEF